HARGHFLRALLYTGFLRNVAQTRRQSQLCERVTERATTGNRNISFHAQGDRAMSRSKKFLIAGLLALPFILSACSQYKSVEHAKDLAQLPEPAAEFQLKGRFHNQQPIAGWWAQLNDEQLNHLINTALAHNHNIRIAQA